MQANDLVKATGSVSIIKKNAETGVEEYFYYPNLVTTVGKTWIAAGLTNTPPNVASYMAIGSSSTAAAVGDTILGAESARSALGTLGGVAALNVVTYTASYGAGVGTGNVYEAGLFNASSAGTLICHTVFGLVTKGANDSLSITWTLTLS